MARNVSRSWQEIASDLDWTESTLFDAQIQEAIRFDLGPKVLFAKDTQDETSDLPAGFSEQNLRQARQLAIDYIARDPMTYGYWCLKHLTSTLTAATYATGTQRRHVWNAIRQINPLVWQLARLRDDYPNPHFNMPLRSHTVIYYTVLRSMSIVALVIGAITALYVVRQTIIKRQIPPGCGVYAFGFMWTFLNAVPVALTVFPEKRYVDVSLWSYAVFAAAGASMWRRRTSSSHHTIQAAGLDPVSWTSSV